RRSCTGAAGYQTLGWINVASWSCSAPAAARDRRPPSGRQCPRKCFPRPTRNVLGMAPRTLEHPQTMRLTKSTSHAIRILIDCARAGDRLTKVAELSQHLQITPQNVFKIVNLLARAGLIEAMRGRN